MKMKMKHNEYNCELLDVTKNNIQNLYIISNKVLPIHYPMEYFYKILPFESYTTTSNKKKVVHGSKNEIFYTKLAAYHGIPIGCIKAKTLFNKNNIIPIGIYIEIIAILGPYRNKRIGRKLLNYVEDECKKSFIHKIYVHVSVNNLPAIKWYQKLGFVESDVLPNMYQLNDGNSCNAIIMVKTL
ncbi:peptide alpha-N-acetyltransferase subunit NAT5 SCDLUD_002181 [Saccharomycodes ludwigii]|uniref:peptide alpha-N-acetyltransferase subunit NAT5 n=1 Tax=Saccharomycodes ludwigii TaxID=36035 RepID=UPI001E8894B3|nr:hypothetical protein SCDLUD_002181 [Saccharomycodes ludwigii]KAH3902361.1 hypothetical protein SCDLUD_002181 [Saccharomycodes ludwigii]